MAAETLLAGFIIRVKHYLYGETSEKMTQARIMTPQNKQGNFYIWAKRKIPFTCFLTSYITRCGYPQIPECGLDFLMWIVQHCR